MAGGMAAAVLAYDRPGGPGYSFANHFVSELGWAESSPRAWAFNGGVALAGLLFTPILWRVARLEGTRWGFVAGGVGVATGLAGVLVGLVPMGGGGPHLVLAAVYFWLLMIGAILYTAVFRQAAREGRARGLYRASRALLAGCVAFTAAPKGELMAAHRNFEAYALSARPAVRLLALLEWCVIALAVVFVLVAAAHLLRRGDASSPIG